jgi:hypothetical protein
LTALEAWATLGKIDFSLDAVENRRAQKIKSGDNHRAAPRAQDGAPHPQNRERR